MSSLGYAQKNGREAHTRYRTKSQELSVESPITTNVVEVAIGNKIICEHHIVAPG